MRDDRPLRVFIGPDKAGSSWLHRLLGGIPGIATPTPKDTFFFDRYFDRGVGWYESRFPPTGDVRVEVCHDYLFSAVAARRLATYEPSARALVIARHPAERAYSAYHYMIRQGRIDQQLSFLDALVDVPELLEHGAYGRHLAPWLTALDGRVTVLDFEELRRDELVFAGQVSRGFGLAIPEDELSAALPGVVRGRAQPRVATVARMGKWLADRLRDRGADDVLGRLKSSRVVDSLLYRTTSEPQTLPREARTLVADRLAADAVELDRLVGTSFADAWWG